MEADGAVRPSGAAKEVDLGRGLPWVGEVQAPSRWTFGLQQAQQWLRVSPALVALLCSFRAVNEPLLAPSFLSAKSP